MGEGDSIRLFYFPDNTKDVYTVDIWRDQCESFEKMMNSPRIDSNTIEKRIWKGYIGNSNNNCNIITKKEQTGVYFCQKLGNPEQKRECY